MNFNNTVKEFNLEAVLDHKPIMTRNGKPAKFVAVVPQAAEYNRIVYVNDNGVVRGTYLNGRQWAGQTSQEDLVMAPLELGQVQLTQWFNVYNGMFGTMVQKPGYDTQGEAEQARMDNTRGRDYVGTIEMAV